MWYVYFLSLANGDVYVGFAKDLRARVKRHNAGQVRSTKAHLPASLLSYVAVLDRPTAIALETYFKSGSGKAFANKRLWP
jgi:predicted GIY-YIG superfamily endonuclease